MEDYNGTGPGSPYSRSGDYSAPGIEQGTPVQPQHTPQYGGPAGPYRTPPPSTRQPKRRVWPVFLSAFIGALIGALLILLVLPWGFGVNPIDIIKGKVRNTTTQQEPSTNKQVQVVSPSSGSVDVTTIAKKVTPSIVNINVDMNSGQGGTGSGVIYTADGYILTNNHVAGGASSIKVILASGEEIDGKLVGADPENDIAVVKINKSGMPPLALGDSDTLVVGELAVAVGSPFGFEQTVTSGIISGLHRTVMAGSETGSASTTVLTDLIQTDAAINPGNSGGALTNSASQLIGLNTLIATQSGGSEGVGFAIPVNTAKRVADDLIAGRAVSHPYIGIGGQTVSDTIATQYNLPVSKGAYVTQVQQGSPADKAGIKQGDIVVAIDGKPINGMDDLISAVRTKAVGDKMSITFYSNGTDKKSATVTLEEKPKNLTQ